MLLLYGLPQVSKAEGLLKLLLYGVPNPSITVLKQVPAIHVQAVQKLQEVNHSLGTRPQQILWDLTQLHMHVN